ncbi:MAG: L,D-transpeptidase family protein [Chloroflexi bacterium]|nr:L,D-transpeptidase family protein [Chloroflexota bacterium]
MKKLLAVLCVSIVVLGLFLPVATPASAASWTGYVSTDVLNVRSAPSAASTVIDVLYYGDPVAIVDEVAGEGGTWYETISGWYVSSAYISSQVPSGSAGGAVSGMTGRWIDVDLSNQTATAFVGDAPQYTAYVTTGKPGHETPTGTYYIFSRVYNETMLSTVPGDEYYLENVYFTQYFAGGGYALHYNYWQPASVFGNTPTSHGCVGMDYGAAAYFWDFADYGTPVVIHY